ncbi:MAG: hypothetical protein FJ278_10725 [Planctomycetes bacterium]|nr:hypothetical protein [Planctomycetota bacterium]
MSPLKHLERLIATKLPWLAAHGLCLKKHGDLIETLIAGTSEMLKRLQARFGDEVYRITERANFELGQALGERMKREYGLGGTVKDGLTLIQMEIIPFGIQMRVLLETDDEVTFEKTHCPMFDAFRRQGVDYCDLICMSAARGALATLSPSLRLDLTRRPGEGHYCQKRLHRVLSA